MPEQTPWDQDYIRVRDVGFNLPQNDNKKTSVRWTLIDKKTDTSPTRRK